jgi:hypothetical protein
MPGVGGYGFWKKDYPVIEQGATDKASNGAVLFVARKAFGDDDLDEYPLFDAALHAAVMQYQREKGLYVDGVVGKDTYRAMGYEMPSARAYKKPFFSQGWVLPAGIVLAAVAIGAGIVFWPRRGEYVERAKAWRKK